MEDYLERGTTVVGKRVQDAERVIMQEQEDMITAEKGGATSRKPEKTFEEMLNAIADSSSDLASSDVQQDAEDKEDDEDDAELGNGSDDDPGWVLDTISKTVQHRMQSFRQQQMRIDELTQPGWGEAAKYIRERDMKYETAQLQLPAVVKPQIDMTEATPSPTTYGELLLTLDIVCEQSQMPAVTSWQWSSQMMLYLEKPLSYIFIPVFSTDVVPNPISIEDAKPVEQVRFYPCT